MMKSLSSFGDMGGAFGNLMKQVSTDFVEQAKRARTQVLKVCTKGHPLKMRKSPFPRRDAETGEVKEGANLQCWGCKSTIICKRGYYRCDYTGCDYDVGIRCGLVADLEWGDDESEPIDDAGIHGDAK